MTPRECIEDLLAAVGVPWPGTTGDAILTALAAAGFAVVPREPTEAMMHAAENAHLDYDAEEPWTRAWALCWSAMLAAATQPDADLARDFQKWTEGRDDAG